LTQPAAAAKAVQDRGQGHWQLIPGADASLREIGFPIDGKMAGRPLRDRIKDDKEAARRFVVWCQAGALHGERRWAEEDIDRLYAEFCRADHRHPTPANKLKQGLRACKRSLVYDSRPVQQDGRSRPVRWSIAAGKYPKPPKQEAQPEPAPAKEGRLLTFPFSAASSGLEPYWLPLASHERMKAVHRIRRQRNHKQRWDQANRRAA
jgi:hypothetical protein